jgi:hypothetical protein
MRKIFNRFMARRSFNALSVFMSMVPMSHIDYNELIKSLDILRRLMDKEE